MSDPWVSYRASGIRRRELDLRICSTNTADPLNARNSLIEEPTTGYLVPARLFGWCHISAMIRLARNVLECFR